MSWKEKTDQINESKNQKYLCSFFIVDWVILSLYKFLNWDLTYDSIWNQGLWGRLDHKGKTLMNSINSPIMKLLMPPYKDQETDYWQMPDLLQLSSKACSNVRNAFVYIPLLPRCLNTEVPMNQNFAYK